MLLEVPQCQSLRCSLSGWRHCTVVVTPHLMDPFFMDSWALATFDCRWVVLLWACLCFCRVHLWQWSGLAHMPALSWAYWRTVRFVFLLLFCDFIPSLAFILADFIFQPLQLMIFNLNNCLWKLLFIFLFSYFFLSWLPGLTLSTVFEFKDKY